MEIAFTLIAGKTVHFTPNHTIKMYLTHNGALVEGSPGEDVFTYNGALLPDTPVGATGRMMIHEPQPDLAAFAGRPGVAVPLPQDARAGLRLCIDTNLILCQGELQTYYRLEAAVDGRVIPLPLQVPLMRIDWREKGIFIIEVDDVV